MEEEDKEVIKAPEKVVFDMPRLVEDINGVFQKELTKNKVELNSLVSSSLVAYKNEADAVLANVKEELIQKVLTRTVVNINIVDREPINIEVSATDHPKTEEVLKSLTLTNKAMLVGPTGTGKTTMIEKIAGAMGVEFNKYSCSRDSSVHDLLGYKQPRSEEYLETTFLKTYEEGGIFLVDEYDAMSGDMALFFNGVADNSSFISVPHRDNKPKAIKHKDFYLIMCGNTYGKGSIEYSGRDIQDGALMDRFRLCKHHIGYNEALEKAFMGADWDKARRLRSCLEDIGSYLSTRNLEEIAQMTNNGMSFPNVVKLLVADLEGEDQEIIMNVFTRNNVSETEETERHSYNDLTIRRDRGVIPPEFRSDFQNTMRGND